MKLLILAGGYGTRLYPLVKDTPKALLEVAGKTLIDHTLEKFHEVEGIDEAVVVTNEKFFLAMETWAKNRQGGPFPVKVLNDGTTTPEDRLGAIGDVLFVLEKDRISTDWVVIGSDNLFDFGVKDFVKQSQKNDPSVTIGCFDIQKKEAAREYGVLELDEYGKILGLQEKPEDPKSSLISMCLYFFPKDSQGYLKAYVDETGKTDTTGGFLQWLYQKTDVYGFQSSGRWYDIGSIESYHEAQGYFLA